MKVEFYEPGSCDSELKFVVIPSVHNDKWVFVRHQDRDTWEFPGGHIEAGENIDAAAKRELSEESGAEKFSIVPVCDYEVTSDGRNNMGRVYFARIETFGEQGLFEMDGVLLSDGLPDKLTYDHIIRRIFSRVVEFIDLQEGKMRLVKYDNVSEEQYLSYIGEWEGTGEKIIPHASGRGERTFEEILYQWEYGSTEAVRGQGFVPATLYFLTDDTGYIYGAAHLRHELNDSLLEYGGHIGYGIRPSERGKGYGKLQLELMLDMLRDKGYEKILITCDDDNYSSASVIEDNGGILENKVKNDNGLGRRYWINLR